MRFYKNYLSMLFISSTLILSCNKVEESTRTDQSLGDFEKGIIVVNHGSSTEFGSLSFIKSDFSASYNEVYSSVNSSLLGKNIRSLAFGEQEAFIVSSGSNTLIAINRYSMIKTGLIDYDLRNPRHVVVADGKLFISNWGDVNDQNDDYIAIFDLFTFQLIEKIAVEFGPDKMIASNSNRLYVAHSGGLQSNNKVTVINTNSNTISSVLQLGDIPESLQLDEAGLLWVLCEGKPASSGQETNGKLYKIDTRNNHTISAEFEMIQQHPKFLATDGVNLYYVIDNAIYKMNVQSTSLPVSPLISGLNVYSLTVASNYLYIGDARDFISPGNLMILDNNGALLNQFVVGIRPIGVYFNN